MSASLSRYLKDFSAPKIELAMMPPKYFPDMDDDGHSGGVFSMSHPLQPQIDIEVERRDAFEDGRRKAEDELTQAHAQDIAALNARHATEIEAIRTQCENEIAAMIYDRFCDLGSQLVTMLSDQTARVLAPVMTDALVRKAVEELGRTIRHSVEAGEGCKIVVKGPTTLFEALKTHMTDETLVFRHLETEDVDLTVEFGDSILVTRIAAWSDTVKKVLA